MGRNRIRRIGFVATRLAGTDGVSLETRKWAQVLERNGYECFFFAGLLETPPERSRLVPEAHFDHPRVRQVQRLLFGRRTRPPAATREVHELREVLKDQLAAFVDDFGIELLIPENALAIPMHVPLGLAIGELIAERGLPTIAHHHDFSWERDRFLVNACTDYLAAAFPPVHPAIRHAVINSLAAAELSRRRGISTTVIPNVLDFANPPAPDGAPCRKLREAVGLGADDPFILQPTRVVPRKWIERSIELVSALGLAHPALVISHASGDEGDEYAVRIREYAERLGVRLVCADRLVGAESGHGRFSIADIYRCADLVTYPSAYEGFGNAFLEAIYFRRPIIVNRYSIYVADIEPRGFDVPVLEGFVTEDTVRRVDALLKDPERTRRMVEHNYRLAARYFSYEVLETKLLHLIRDLEAAGRAR